MTRYPSPRSTTFAVARSLWPRLILALGSAAPAVGHPAPAIPEAPLVATQAATPMGMMVVGRDHTLFYEAYNDASDIDGDGVLDIRFKPAITYYGLFDSTLCYTHSGSNTNTDLFTPSGLAGTLGTCSGTSEWSGNWLNYVTTSRIDALRKVFYGGQRDVDQDGNTVLRRAYIPQDAHSWAKEYTSQAVDGYRISDYTPLSQPAYGKRHFFGNLTETDGVNCRTLSNCSGKAPLLRVITDSDTRVWTWASSERPVLNRTLHGGTLKDHTVRVQVCTSSYYNGCKRYPNGNLKPVGLLHEYGENDTMLFGLLTGSYNKNMSGGVLRKVVSSFKDEVSPDTGIFTANATIVKVLGNLRIRDFNNQDDGHAWNIYRGGWELNAPMREGQFVDWGNPIGEMMYEALRYFAGKDSPTAAFSTSGGYDADVGLSAATWDDPYGATSAAKAKWCARSSMLVVSGINPSFDSDQLPGSRFGTFAGDLTDLDVASIAQTITDREAGITGSRFIGQSGTDYDGAPTAKNVTSLGAIRGLAPEEPTKQGSYYSASVAHYGKTTDLRPTLTGTQSVDTYAVVLSSPLPRIEARTASGKTITLVPFAKTVTTGTRLDGDGANASSTFQPTNQLVDFYVDTIVNSTGASGADYNPNVNGGRYYAKFRINFEDVEQGADHDMDVIVIYEVSAEADGRLRVKLTPEYQQGAHVHSMGYVISGTTNDGVYLVVQDENVEKFFYLNVPPGMNPGACDASRPSDVANAPAACHKLPYLGGPDGMNSSDRYFLPGNSTATLLRDPLWYAAKWGGFTDANGNKRPDLPVEWDADGDGVPDTYFLVQNPLKLREALKRSLDTIIERSASAGNITSNGQQLQTGSKVFQAQFNSAKWEGELFAYAVTASGVAATPAWRASARLPAASDRNIFTWRGGTPKGVPFVWDTSTLTDAQRTTLGSRAVLEHLRGDQQNEIERGGTLRTRSKLLGDIVHSSPYYVKDTDTVYVGANDGMLHAFSASSGDELFAYIPALIFDKLPRLAQSSYAHTYYVDGDIAVSSRTQTPNRNILVASTGRGAKGLFALDVTTPGDFGGSNVLWEYSGAGDNDLGYILGRPQIGILESGDKVVVVGNGHNSVNGNAVLYVFNLETGQPKRISTGGGPDNGLSTPLLVDSDNNGKIDTVYAGDLKGNVWRYDLSSTSSNGWVSHYRDGNGANSAPLPFFTARDASGNPQPITAQPTVGVNTVTSDPNFGKRFVFFGTGSYVYSSDPSDLSVQTWYGLIDEGVNPRISGRSELRERTITNTGSVSGHATRVFSEAADGDMVGRKGWYVDLEDPSARGERIVTRSMLTRFLEPVLLASSIIPNADPCESGGSGFVNAINPFSGVRLAYPPFDLNDDGRFDLLDKLAERVIGSFDPGVGMPGEATVIGNRLVVGGSSGDVEDIRVNTGIKRTGRISWREILRD